MYVSRHRQDPSIRDACFCGNPCVHAATRAACQWVTVMHDIHVWRWHDTATTRAACQWVTVHVLACVALCVACHNLGARHATALQKR